MTDSEYVKCDLCNKSDSILLFKGRDYRFGRKEEYNLVKCNNCGLIYMNPRPTIESISKLYEACYTPNNKSYILPTLETQKIRIILKRIWHRFTGRYHDNLIKSARGRVLDIGCGNGNLLLPIRQNGEEVYGVEINPINSKYCNKMGLNVFCGVLEEANFNNDFFDIVILSQVIEHLPSPKKTIEEIYRILKPGGRLYIFCPNYESYLSKLFGKYWHGWYIPFHFYDFNENTIRRLTEEVGFKVKSTTTITPDNFFIVSLKDYFFGEKKSNTRPINRGKYFDSIFFRIVISPVFRLLDLLTQNGDCLKVELEK